jgi:Cu+-exporting ATPase
MAECCHSSGAKAWPVNVPPGARYTCPMHPEIVRDAPGDCPICGMALEPMGVPIAGEDDTELGDMTRRLVVSAVLTVPVFVLAMGHMAHGVKPDFTQWRQAGLSALVLFWGGWPFLRRAWQSLLNRSANMFTLIATGTLAAWFFSMLVILAPSWIGSTDVYFEAAAVIITLVLAGQFMELRARRRTGQALRALMDLAPATAWKVVADGSTIEVPLGEVVTGDVLRVRPGDKVPVDGIVTIGESTLDESMLTGESAPVEVQPGRKVRAGTINRVGSFDLRAEAVGPSTMLSQIVEMVAQAQRGRAPVQDLADRVSSVFVPAVVLVAVITFAGWLMATGSWPMALTASVSVLIIACPCAIGLAVPMSVMVGVGRAARHGVLVRQPAALERLEKIDTLCVDKTGTLTEGRPGVVQIVTADGQDEKTLLSLAAALESKSEHPLGLAVVRSAQEQGVSWSEARNFAATPGGGVSGKVEGRSVLAGAPAFTGSAGVVVAAADGRSRVDLSADGAWLGTFILEDAIKPSALQTLEQLRRRGLRVVMLTGDREGVARLVASALGITEFQAGLSPQDKATAIQAMQTKGHHVCMAGDGVNDAPALALADTSIAMGLGSDVAKETADFILVQGSLEGVVRAFALGTAIMRNIRQNLFLAFAYNTLGIPLAAGVLYPLTGWLLSPMLAGAAMSLSSVSVIGNALRLARARA